MSKARRKTKNLGSSLDIMDPDNMLLGADAADDVDAKCVKQMKDGRRGGGKRGR